MANVSVIEKRPNLDTIDQLEKVLERAKSGELLGAVIIQSFDDNCTNHIWSGVQPNAIRIIGELMVAASALAGHVEDSRK